MNNYHIYEDIAKGKHSVIYKARKKKTIDYYAVKSMDKCKRKKLMNEIKIFHSLDHDNILKYYNWYETKNHLWAIFEYSSGGNLLSLIEQDKKLTESQVKVISKDLVQGVIYCDLKPSNILLNEYQTLKFSDFGLARHIVDLIQTDEDVKEGSKKATAYYMAPELFQDNGVFSFQSDLWSLGCVIYELATGKPPFGSKSFQDLVSQILNNDPEKVASFSNEFHSFIFGLLQKNPSKRFGWKEIINHPFLNWNSIQLKNLSRIEIPSQPHFDKWYLNKYGIQGGRYLQNGQSNLSSNLKNQNETNSRQFINETISSKGVNVLRLSLNVQKNLKKEQQEDIYQNETLSQQQNGNQTLSQNSTSNYNTTASENKNFTNKVFYNDQNITKKNENDFILLNRDQIIDIGNGEKEDIENEEELLFCPVVENIGRNKSNLIQDQQKTLVLSPYLEDQENLNNYSNNIIKKSNQLESVFKGVFKNKNFDNNSNFFNQNPQSYPFSSGKIMNQNSTTNPQVQVQKYSLSNRSRLNQDISTGRQGQQTSNSPNNLNKTPNSRDYSTRNNSNGGNNQHLQNLTTVVKQNLNKNCYSPHNNKSEITQSTLNGRSISPYQKHNSIYQQTALTNYDNNSILSNLNNTSILNTPTTPMNNNNISGTTTGFYSIGKNGINFQNQHFLNTNNYSSIIRRNGINNSNNSNTIYQNQSHNQHLNNDSSRNNSSNAGILSSNCQNSLLNKISLSGNNFENKNSETQQLAISKKSSFILENLDKLFFHSTDTQVKPIIGHKDIEKQVQELNYQKETLPFQYFSVQEVESGIEKQEIQNMFEQIFSYLQESNLDKNNILCYFESVIMNSNVSNLLVNSGFVNLLLEILEKSKVTQIRLRAASSIGFLLRYSTVINNQLSKLNIPTIVIEVFSQEKEIKVRRKLMATLGEYLFYAATQVDENPTNSLWKIQPQILNFLTKIIKIQEEDEIVKFYATKTVENITSQSITIGLYFCNQDTISTLINLYFFTQNENLKACTIVTLTQMARLNDTLTEFIIIQLQGVSKLIEILRGDNFSARIQQAVITLFNIQIQKFPSSEMAQVYMIRDPNFIEIIVSLFESSHTIIRGKSIISLYLCIKYNPQCLIDLCQTKYFTQFDKLSRDNFKYIQQCYQHIKILNENQVPIMLQSIKDEINRISQGEVIPLTCSTYYYMQNNNQMNNGMPNLQGNLQYIHAIIFQQNYLEEFFSLVDIIYQHHNSQLQEAKSVLMNLCEVILSNTSYIIDKREYFIGVLLPKLVDQLYMNLFYGNTNINGSGMSKDNSPLMNNSNNSSSYEGADWKFNYMKLIHDIVSIFMAEWQKWSQNLQQRTNELFITKFIGNILNGLVRSSSFEDSVNLLTFKVLQILVENQPSLFISALKQKNLINVLLQQFNYNATRCTLKLVAKIVQVSTLQEIQTFGIYSKSVSLFQHFISKEQDQCYEDMIDIFLNITTKIVSLKPILNIDKPCYFDSFVDHKYDILLEAYNLSFTLLRSLDFSLSDKVGMFIIQMIYIYGKSNKNNIIQQSLIKNDHILTLLNYISQFQMISPILKRNTRILNWIVQLFIIPKNLKEIIHVTIEKVSSSSKDLKNNQILREILFNLKSQNFN